MAYLVRFKKSAAKQLRLLPKAIIRKVATAIDELADEPRPVGCKKLQAVEDTYRIRVGDFRVLYTIDDSIVTVEVIKIGNRQDVYKS